MNFFKQIWLACSGFRTYREFMGQPLRTPLIYWGILSAILGVVAIINFYIWYGMAYPTIVKEAVRYLPEFEFRDGKAWSSFPQPLITNTNQFPIIQDIHGSIAQPEKMFPGGLLISEKDLVFWLDGKPPVKLPWGKGLQDGKVNEEYLDKLGKDVHQRLPLFFPVVWLTIMLVGLIQAFLFTALAGFLEKTMEHRFTFLQLFNIAIYALTPGCILVAAWASARFFEIRHDLVYFTCYCLVTIMASSECRLALQKKDGKDGDWDEEEDE